LLFQEIFAAKKLDSGYFLLNSDGNNRQEENKRFKVKIDSETP